MALKYSLSWPLFPSGEKRIVIVILRIVAARVADDVNKPIILPANHVFTRLLFLEEHERNAHQGVNTILNNLRTEYCITAGGLLGGRAVNALCVTYNTPSPSYWKWDHFHVTAWRLSKSFSFTGVDMFGPLEVVVGRHQEKRWGILFGCMVTRAVYLDVAYGLRTDDFMLVLSKFVDQRGRPRHMYSRNGTNFVGAAKELKEALKTMYWERITSMKKFSGISWHLISPGAPHMGGAWERMVKGCVQFLPSPENLNLLR